VSEVFEGPAGTYTTSIGDESRARALSLVGDYTMEISDEGVMDVQGPPAFELRWTSPAGPIEARDGKLRVFTFQAHCTTAGVYTWSLDDGDLVFELVDDSCRFRRALLARGWRSADR
jgi:hypothetical protein